MANTIKTNDLQEVSVLDERDTFVVNANKETKLIPWSYIKTVVWGDIMRKPFSSVGDGLSVQGNELSLAQSVKDNLHSHNNKDVIDGFGLSAKGGLLWNGEPIEGKSVSTWSELENKPFNVLSSDFSVFEGILSVADSIKSQLHTHANKTVLDKLSESSDKLLFDGKEIVGGMDFAALATAMTTGTQDGITITADSDNERFNFTVNGLPELSINSDGEWCIDGVSTHQSAHGNSVTASAVEGGIEIKIVKPDGTETSVGVLTNGSKGDKGDDGTDGISPIVTFVEQESQIIITVIDADGTKTTTIDTNNITRAEFDELKNDIIGLNALLETRLNGGEV